MTKDRLCPFRKQTVMVDYRLSGNGGVVNTEYGENFLPCIGKKCAAYWSDTITKTGLTHPIEVDGCKLIFKGY